MNPSSTLRNPTSNIKRKSEPMHYGYIDALRGLAILGVFIVHSSQHILHLPGKLFKVCTFGQYGVQLFFVLSALTLLLSFHSRSQEKQTTIRNFYLRRFFRIAPLFWIGIILYNYQGLQPNFFSPSGIGWGQVFATFTFVHGWYPTYINSVVPGGWSIAVETTFYAIFPILAVRLPDQRRILLALLLTIIFGNVLNHILYNHMNPYWQGHRAPVLSCFLTWWFPSQLPVFLIGFLLYHKVKGLTETAPRSTSSRRQTAFVCVIGAWLTIAILIHGSSFQSIILGKARTGSLLSAGFAGAFALLVYGLALVPFPLFVNRFFRYLGLISYSGYIDHFIVLDKTGRLIDSSIRHLHFTLSPTLHYAVFCAVALPATIALATVTYHFVEKPGITLGKKLIGYLDTRQASLTI